jgi:chlorophyll synthase
MNPVTWLAPAWAFLCGAVASDALAWSPGIFLRLLAGVLMAGPILCGLSQVINNYCDREVDAINEPQRPVPAGLVSLRHIQVMSLVLTLAGTLIALFLGPEVALFVGVGLVFAVAYSLKPLRAKRNGWVGNALVAFSYEGLAWMAGHAAVTTPHFWESATLWQSTTLAVLYSISAHGIMTVNDFKSVAGDAQMGIRSIPVMYGKKAAAWLVVGKMALAQLAVVVLLFVWGNPVSASLVLLLLLAQVGPFRRFVLNPEHNEVFFNLTVVQLSIWGMLVAAIGLAF